MPWYADNPLEGGVKSADVTVTDLLSTGTLLADSVSHSTSTNSPPNGDWILYSGNFTATGTSTRLLFASTSASDSPSGGIILDAVSVQPVPEPGAFVLAGLGLLGLGMIVRRNKYCRI
ncbi:MAG TPA: PEP-CTERM sorting domain-containing protein [Pirellulales bacterium]|nr:PEP-CTERM sorting domain-containing protein [Pirellulales bacterium]